MSLLLAVTSTVAATPLPTVTPQVVKEIITNVPVVPQDILTLASLLALMGAGSVTSFVHQLLDRGRWAGNVNRLVLAGYSTAAALVYAYLQGGLALSLDSVIEALTGFVVVLGSASGRYELFRFLMSASTPKEPAPTPADPPVAEDVAPA